MKEVKSIALSADLGKMIAGNAAFDSALFASAVLRSAWHTHPAGQTLIVTKGVIITGTEQGEVQIAREGDTILCPPNLKHWHGAGDKQSGAHIALTGVKDGNNVK